MGSVKWWLLAAFVVTLDHVSAGDAGRYGSGKVCASSVVIRPSMTCDLIANLCKISPKELFERNPYFENGAVCNGPLKVDQTVCCSYRSVQQSPQMPYAQKRYQQSLDESNSLDQVFDKDDSPPSEKPGGAAPSTDACSWKCPRKGRKVCGSDGRTYPCMCHLRRANCRDRSIKRKHMGPCRVSQGLEDDDFDGQGFDDFDGAADDDADFLDEDAADGDDFDDGVLADDQDDALDEEPGRAPQFNGVLCRFRWYRLLFRQLCRGRFPLANDPDGGRKGNGLFPIPPPPRWLPPRCGFPCGKILSPVCASNGVTYPNWCELRRARCVNPRIFLVRPGNCGGRWGLSANNDDFPAADVDDFDAEGSERNDQLLVHGLCLLRPFFRENRRLCRDIRIGLAFGQDGFDGGMEGFDGMDGLDLNDNEGFRVGHDVGGGMECGPKCPYDIVAPVCGSDGRTYSNLCVLKKKACKRPSLKLTMVSHTECPQDYANRTSQARVGRPRGRFHGRGFGWRGSRFWGWGPFGYLSPFWLNPGFLPACPAICSPTFMPVCGSDGRTYYNECQLRQTACASPFLALGVTHGGQCLVRIGMSNRDPLSGPSDDRKPAVCKSLDQCRPEVAGSQPVCGSDGQTYANLCQLEVESCKNPTKSLYMVTDAPCRTDVWSSCQENCTKVASPVCGSDGTTYLNDCFLRLAACRHYGKSIVKASDGSCPGDEAPPRSPQTMSFAAGFGLGTAVASRVNEGCFTIFGERCRFPFRYKGVQFNRCTTEDFPFPWCATRTDALANGSGVLRWNKCALGPDC